MTRRALLRELDAAELAEWEVFWEMEPFGDEWRQMARMMQTNAIGAGLRKRSGGGWSEDDFMPAGYKPPKARDDSADALESTLMGWAKATNAAAKKSRKKK